MHKKIKAFLWLAPFLASVSGYFFIAYTFQSRTIKTPHFIGLSLHQAMLHAAAQNIRLQIVSEKEYAHVEPGTVIEQRPHPDFLIKEKQSIHIITARAPKEKIAPALLGKAITDVDIICEQKRIKHKHYFVTSNSFSNSCIAQIPESGTAIKDNKIITYIAQTASPFVILPNFTGLNLDDIIIFLKQQTITFSVYEKAIKLQAPYPKNRIVLNQKPLVGSFIKFDQSAHIQLQI